MTFTCAYKFPCCTNQNPGNRCAQVGSRSDWVTERLQRAFVFATTVVAAAVVVVAKGVVALVAALLPVVVSLFLLPFSYVLLPSAQVGLGSEAATSERTLQKETRGEVEGAKILILIVFWKHEKIKLIP